MCVEADTTCLFPLDDIQKTLIEGSMDLDQDFSRRQD